MFGKKATEKIAEQGLNIIDKAVTDKDKKAEIAHDLVTNELLSGSTFVRNARPMIIYTGLFVILSEVFGLRLFVLSNLDNSKTLVKHSTALMEYFLFTWSGVVSVYIGGRSFEKAKMRGLRKSKKQG